MAQVKQEVFQGAAPGLGGGRPAKAKVLNPFLTIAMHWKRNNDFISTINVFVVLIFVCPFAGPMKTEEPDKT